MMNAYTTKDELALFAAGRTSHSQHYSDDAARRPALLSRIVTFFKQQATMRELRQLTDRELADIGLHRAELHRVFEPNFAAARSR